ncbi:unnamed protein product, partial [Scytosiphon promiscuus]
VKPVQPLYAWDDPQPECLGARRGNHHHRHPRREPSFYDREALQEQLRALQGERVNLSDKREKLDVRLANAQATLLDMRAKKRDLSQAKLIDEAATVLPAKEIAAAGVRAAYKKDRATCFNGDCGSMREARTHRHEENANFAAQDRIMELELLNDQLKKGQAEVKRKAALQKAASLATRAEVQKAAGRLKAMPKRFTQSLQLLRDEVDHLEREKLALELAKQERTSQEADRLACATRQQAYLREELTSLLDEIDDVEDDRDRWKRRLRVENTRTEFLRAKRDEALRDLRDRFGSDAVERAAFAFFAKDGRGGGGRMGAIHRDGRSGGGSGGQVDMDDREDCGKYREDSSSGGGGGDGHPDRSPKIPVSMIARALRPAYGADFFDGDDGDGREAGVASSSRRTFESAVAEALISECGIDCSSKAVEQEAREGEGDRDQCHEMVGFEEFRAVAGRLVAETLS